MKSKPSDINDAWLDKILKESDSVELVEYELPKALLEQGVKPNVYAKLSDKARDKILAKHEAEVERRLVEARSNELRIVPKHNIKTWFDFEVYRRKRLREIKLEAELKHSIEEDK